MRYNNIEIESKRYRKDAYMTNFARLPRFRRDGFTLIELLIVIVLMAILSALLIPMIDKIIVNADTARSKAFVQDVARGAEAFRGQNNGRYPGQDDIGLLLGEGGSYTGSQIIAARLFGYPNSNIEDDTVSDKPQATSKYLEYKSSHLITQSSKKNSLADNSRTSNALLYFPSRLNVTLPTACYIWADNSAYVTEDVATAKTRFESEYATDTHHVAGDVARNEGGILIIGTGANDKYLETTDNDDIKSWDVD